MDESLSRLERIPREIRDQIYQLVLLDPARPILEGKNKSTKYTNYLGLLYVNKAMSREVQTALEEIKPLFIISSNVSTLGKEMIHHGIPYLSDHHVGRVKCHSLRIHVRLPTCGYHVKELKAYVVLSEHLAETCLLLRGRSLAPPNCCDRSMSMEELLVPRIKIAIKLGSLGGVRMLESTQLQLLKQMKWLNHAGSITISGCINSTVEAMVPGYNYLLSRNNIESTVKHGNTLDISSIQHQLTLSEIADGKDSIKFASWKNKIALRAYRAKDFQLALDRYFQLMEFVGSCIETHFYHVLSAEQEILLGLDIYYGMAQLGLVGCHVKLGNWEEATRHYKIFKKLLAGRARYLPERLLDRSLILEMRLQATLGADFDKELSRDDETGK